MERDKVLKLYPEEAELMLEVAERRRIYNNQEQLIITRGSEKDIERIQKQWRKVSDQKETAVTVHDLLIQDALKAGDLKRVKDLEGKKRIAEWQRKQSEKSM